MASDKKDLRTVDDLGRIAIPKEIRINLGIQSGDHLFISTNGDRVILEKYHPNPREISIYSR